MHLKFNEDEKWLLKGFINYGIEKTEDIINDSEHLDNDRKKRTVNHTKKINMEIIVRSTRK